MKKFIIFLLFLFFNISFLIYAPGASAQTPTPKPTIYLPMYPVDEQGNFIRSTNPWIPDQQQVQEDVKSQQPNKFNYDMVSLVDHMHLINLAVGGEQTVQQALGPNGQPLTQNGKPIYETVYKGGAIEIVGNLTAALYSKPASSVEYLADLGSNLGLVPPAYAQGLGFSAFSPVLELWKLFRNLAYLAFVVVFIVVGFMIMFRKKIDPRTVVTIQDALPRIIITLLIITFSYAIAGLIVDLSDLLIKLMANIFFNGTILGTTDQIASRNNVLNSDIFALVNPLRNVQDLVGAIQQSTSVGVNASGGNFVALIAGLTVGLVLWISGFYVMFKIFFSLLTPFVTIVLGVITAPIQLLFGALPDNKGGFLGWIKTMAANVAVFPATFALLSMSAYLNSGKLLNLCREDVVAFGPSALWCPPENAISTLWTPFGLNLGAAVGHLAGFGILFTIPHVAEIINKAIELKPSPFAIGGEELKKSFAGIPIAKNLFQ